MSGSVPEHGLRVGLLAGALFLSLAVNAGDKNELNKVREQIQQKQQEIKDQKKSLNDLHEQLRKDEAAVNTISQRLDKSQQKLQSTKAQLQKLERQRQELAARQKQQEQLLATQLDQAYRMGQNDYLKLLLNQQNPSDIDRTLEYYGYINQARLDAIKQLQETRNQLDHNRKQVSQTSQQLTAVISEQKQNQSELQEKQQMRQATAEELKKSLADDQAQLGKLQIAEKKMEQKIEEARKRLEEERKRKKAEAVAKARAKARKQGRSEAAAEAKVTADIALGDHKGLGKEKGTLPWPLRGQLVRQFGEHRSGEVSWKGILISASNGALVKAIADGDVVFADYLDGFGNVLVIDHGFGYLSLYGNNSSLLKQSGDSIRRGEVIAHSGNSGNQPEPGLYFEIRWQGKPVNPASWLGR